MRELEFKPSFFSNNNYNIKLNLANTINNIVLLVLLGISIFYLFKDKNRLKTK